MRAEIVISSLYTNIESIKQITIGEVTLIRSKR
jgi:hypothetical protein